MQVERCEPLSAEMLNMLNSLGLRSLLVLPRTFNTFSMSAERSTFWFNMGPRIQHVQHFPWKKQVFLEKSPFSFKGPLSLQTSACSVWFSFPPQVSLFPCFRSRRLRVGRGWGIRGRFPYWRAWGGEGVWVDVGGLDWFFASLGH